MGALSIYSRCMFFHEEGASGRFGKQSSIQQHVGGADCLPQIWTDFRDESNDNSDTIVQVDAVED